MNWHAARRLLLPACVIAFLGSFSPADAQPVPVEASAVSAVPSAAGSAISAAGSRAGAAVSVLASPVSLLSVPAPLAAGISLVPSPALPAAAAAAAPAAAAPRVAAPAADVPALGRPAQRVERASPVILELPGGGRLTPMPALTEARMEGAFLSASIPEQGILARLPEGSFDLWPRLLNTRMDLAVLDEGGVVSKVVSVFGRPDREVPWSRTDALVLRGSRVLLLPAGKAELLGLRKGDRVRGADVPVPNITPAVMSKMILSGEEERWSELLDHLRENPGAGLDEALSLVKRELRDAANRGERDSVSLGRRKLRLLLDRILTDETLPYRLQDEASWHAPLRWARSLFVSGHPTIEIQFGSRTYEIPRGVSNAVAAVYELSDLPLTLASSFVHELGHRMAAELVGTPVIRLRVFPSGNGYVSTPYVPGGWKGALIFLAGPLSQMFWGAVLLLIGLGLLSAGGWAGLSWVLAARKFLGGSISGGGATDWPGAAEALGFKRLAHEMRRRWSDPGERHYVRMLLRTLREVWGPNP